MALALPQATQNLVNHGNALISESRRQGLAVHDITFKQKEVRAMIDNMLVKFSNHEAMKKPRNTMAALKEVKASFQMINNNIYLLEAKEKEINGLIQQIMGRQNQGNTESRQIQSQLVSVQNKLDATHAQIHTTRANLHDKARELNQLQRNVEIAEREAHNRGLQRGFLIAAAVLTLGITSKFAIDADENWGAAKRVLTDRRQFYTDNEDDYRRLQSSVRQDLAQKENLTNLRRQKQFEKKKIEEMLNRLQLSLEDTATYRHYLLKLSDAFTPVNSYVESLEKNLGAVAETEGAGFDPDDSMNTAVSNDYEELEDAWMTAKTQPAVQMALNLHFSNHPAATLNAIKELVGRKKGSLGWEGGRSHG